MATMAKTAATDNWKPMSKTAMGLSNMISMAAMESELTRFRPREERSLMLSTVSMSAERNNDDDMPVKNTYVQIRQSNKAMPYHLRA